jgi:Ser/Thr protein kinase RdoA (MazF antagonist)
MARSTWQNLPAAVRTAIESKTGPVAATESPSAGRNSDFSATLYTATGPVFCKAIADAKGGRGRMHRHEADINPWLPSTIAPRLRWRAEADSWLVLGFDHVSGRHADLSPSSSELAEVATTVNAMAEGLAHCSADAPRLAEHWGRLAAWRRLAKSTDVQLDAWTTAHLDKLVTWECRAIELADGGSLVHTDLHSYNILVGSDGARIVDWAWSRVGAAAIDVAFLVARLIAAGHTPKEAERWANDLPVWRATTPAARTAFAVAIWGIWTYKSIEERRPTWNRLVPAAAAWADHRLSVTASQR